MSTVTKCDICDEDELPIGQLIYYEPGSKFGKIMDICGSCSNKYTVREAFAKRKNK